MKTMDTISIRDIKITKEDMALLMPTKWLNDVIING